MVLLAIAIHIDPNLAQLGPFVLSWHGLFSAVGVIAGVTIGVRVAAEAGADEEGAYNLALWSVAGGIVGARIFHVVDNWPYYAQNPGQIIMINEGGIAIYGAFVGGILTGTLYALRTRLDVAKIADGGAIGMILGAAIGRIGDVINGEHHGRILEAPHAVVYTHPNTLGELGLPVHLAVGYEMVWDLLVFALLWLMRGRVRQGIVFWTFLVLYGLGRFWTTFYRVDTIQAFGLTQAQLVAVFGMALGAAMLVRALLRGRFWADPDEGIDEPTLGDPAPDVAAHPGG
jgi:phosphatidylglycerol:prolipoprotein diacylglycerol transferase